jgi:uncharacterized protein (TIGR02996 family)
MTTTTFSQSPTIDALLANLADHPGDTTLMLIIADALEEADGDDGRSAGMRWCVQEDRFPSGPRLGWYIPAGYTAYEYFRESERHYLPPEFDEYAYKHHGWSWFFHRFAALRAEGKL